METVGVLAQVVGNRGLQPEPVATDAHAHTVHEPGGGERAHVARRNADRGQRDHVPFLQHSGGQRRHRRAPRPRWRRRQRPPPDLRGEVRCLTHDGSDQTGTAYLDRLASGQSGVLLFLVPEERIPALWPKLLAGPGAGAATASTHAGGAEPANGVRSVPLAGDRTLAIISWCQLLDTRQPLELAGDARGRGDLEQVAGLVAWRTRSGWLPVQPDDLPDTAGRQLAGISEVVLSAASAASSAKVRNGSTDTGPGRWLKTPSGRWPWAGIWLKGWDRWGTGRCGRPWRPSPSPRSMSLPRRSPRSITATGPVAFEPVPSRGASRSACPRRGGRDDVRASLVAELLSFGALIDTAGLGGTTEEPT